MSQDMFDPELFTDFIAEAREHLETIEPNLLELEKTPDNLALLNEIFRPMHSLKGASGFLGLNRINQVAHRAENILDALRKGTMVVTSEIMDVILTSTDALRQMIDSLEATNTEGDVAIEPIIKQIDIIMSGGSTAPTEPPASAPEQTEVAPQEQPVAESTPAPQPLPKQVLTAKEWVASLPSIKNYALESFGEEHLKDFIDESLENIENLNMDLLALEDDPEGEKELINDIFRYFHNMKGNSGIIGYHELNALTHEAETLLNNVRQDKIKTCHELIDLLLLVVDMMEGLIHKIDIPTGHAEPFETVQVVKKLQQVLAGGKIELPEDLLLAQRKIAPSTQSTSTPVEVVNPVIIPIGKEEGDETESFRKLIQQQMEIINAALATLQKDSTHKESVDALYRCLIAVRNACSAMGLEEVKVYANRTAGIVEQGRKSGIDFGLMIDMMTQETGIINDMVQKAIREGKISSDVAPTPAPAPTLDKPATPPQSAPAQPTPKPATPPAPKPTQPTSTSKPAPTPATQAAPVADKGHKGASTIRVDQWRLDHLMSSIGELIINRNRYTLIARSLESAGTSVNISEVAQDISETTYAMARISDDLQDTIMKVRMVPVSSVFSRFPRLIRDLSRKSGKEIDLIMEGEETELDKSVVEVIGDPLVHLIRNAVDHGIETEEERKAVGKPTKGKVTLRAFHKGNSVAIEIEDDGKGIDPDKMRAVAIKKGIITPEDAAQLDDGDARELIFAPGFSSAEKITDISGRGVGMDVVRTNIKNLKGSVSTSSEVGKGTKFTLILPLTLAIIDALMVNVAGQMYAIPLDAVAETTKIESARLTDIKGRKAVTLRGDVLGIVELCEMLGLPPKEQLPEMLSVVVIHDNERRLGLVVDRLLERQEIVIKPLGAYLGDLQGISGATIMGDGSVILILDPHEIFLMSTSKSTNMSGTGYGNQSNPNSDSATERSDPSKK